MNQSLLGNVLENLPNRIIQDSKIIDDVIEFLRDIYAQGGDKKNIHQVSQAFLKEILSDYPDLLESKDTLIEKIKSKFRYLRTKDLEVMNDFIAAFEMINFERVH